VWLFIPPKDMKSFAASAFAPVSEALISACTSQSPDTELCVMSSETVSPRPLSWRGWQTRPWLRLLYGTICQPFSLAGNRLGKDDPRHLWPEVARIVREVAPRWCFFENVPGHLSLGFDYVAGELQGMGYRVAACVVSAAEVGAPHIRERMFILAHADLQEPGQPGLHPTEPGERPRVQERSESDGQSGWAEERRPVLDVDVGHDAGGGLDAPAPELFPPMPGDLVEWGKTLGRSPGLKPGIHRLGDGVATWLDRSAAAGNGVVPLAAARAWRMLKPAFNDH
jgi:DNA (cytosine-5)-methyltransferase 1